MRKEHWAVVLIKWLCWAFVLGVGIANVLGPQGRPFMINMWMLCGLFVLLSGFLFFAYRKLARFTLIPAIIILGIASYQYRFNLDHPNHITNFISQTRWDRVELKGRVIAEPDIREHVTHLRLRPEAINRDPEGEGEWRELSGPTGDVLAFVSRDIREDNPYYDNMRFGDRVRVRGGLSEPMRLSNPYGFDYGKYLNNQNIYATVYVGDGENIKWEGVSDIGLWGSVMQFAFGVRERMILGIKKTVPPPASAFLGGVTVGARGGVPEEVQEDFRATGVAHVLALSGLHVGFLALVLVALFTTIFKSRFLFYTLPTRIFKKNTDITPYSPKIIPLFVISALLIFVIITGARPATVRAAMMYSIGIVFYLWFGMKLNRAGRITIPMSAAIMLSMNSFLIFEASFTLSFTAVWSIIYLSGPLRKIFTKMLSGWGMALFYIFVISSVGFLLVAPWVYSSAPFVAFFILIFAALAAGAYFLEKKIPLRGLEFEGWWPFISGFFCVQLAIQLGMMWPLSGLYFNRFPIAGIIANFIAIPLIGIIVPLGMMGQLFTFIPGAGEWIGLTLGASSTVMSEFFLHMARFFRVYFPYPVQAAPTSAWLVAYYIAILIFAFNRQIRFFLERKFKLSPGAGVIVAAVMVAFVYSGSYWVPGIFAEDVRKRDEALITIFDVEFGNSILIQTPGGKTILVDGGHRGTSRYWTRGGWGQGESVLLPNLSGYNISRVDKLITTNPLPENIGGLIYVLENFNVGEVWDGLDPENFTADMPYAGFLDALGDIRLQVRSDAPLPVGVYLNYYDFLNAVIAPREVIDRRGLRQAVLEGKLVPHLKAEEGTVIYSEERGEKEFNIRVLNPPSERISGTEDDMKNNSVVLMLTYGRRKLLFTSNITSEGEYDLVERYGEELGADLITVPGRGSSKSSSPFFVDTVRPVYAVAQYGYLRDRSFYHTELDATLRRWRDAGALTFRTDRDGAVKVRTDGRGMDVTTVLGEGERE